MTLKATYDFLSHINVVVTQRKKERKRKKKKRKKKEAVELATIDVNSNLMEHISKDLGFFFPHMVGQNELDNLDS